MNQATLPDNLILQITQSLDVATLKTLRLTCRHINSLIQQYEKSISSDIIAAFHSEETNDRFKSIVTCSQPNLRSLFALESRHRRGQWLLGILLQEFETEDSEPLPESGQDILASHASILNGFAILWSLSDIANNTENESLPTVRCDEEAEQPVYVQRTLDLWRNFAADLSYQDRFDYNFMRELLATAFYGSVYEDPEQDLFEMGIGSDYLDNRNSWLSWFVFTNGPKFFEIAWSSQQSNQVCVEDLHRRWSSRSWNERLWEYRAGREIEMVLMGYGENSANKRDVFHQRLFGTNFPAWSQRVTGTPFHIGYQLSPSKAHEWAWNLEFGDQNNFPRLLQSTRPTLNHFRAQQGDPLFSDGDEEELARRESQ